jgi:hypothetical protein
MGGGVAYYHPETWWTSLVSVLRVCWFHIHFSLFLADGTALMELEALHMSCTCRPDHSWVAASYYVVMLGWCICSCVKSVVAFDFDVHKPCFKVMEMHCMQSNGGHYWTVDAITELVWHYGIHALLSYDVYGTQEQQTSTATSERILTHQHTHSSCCVEQEHEHQAQPSGVG